MILRSFKRRTDGILLWVIGAQTAPQQFMNALKIRPQRHSIAAGDAPPYAPTRREIGLRKPAESNHRHIRRERRQRNVLTFERKLVVNLVRKHHQIVLASKLSN